MVSPRRASLLAALALALLLATSVLPATAAPPPESLCGCGDAVESGAANHGLDLTAASSTATVRVHENGSATWVVRVRVADADSAAMDRFRANATLRADVVDGAVRDTALRSAAVDGDTLVARFHDPGFAERSTGVLRSAAFTNHHEGYLRLADLGADELTVVAPEGMAVGWSVPGSTVADDGREMTLTSLDERDVGHFVTFVPRDAPLAPLRSLAAVGGFVAPTLFRNVGLFVLASGGLFAASVGAVGTSLSWTADRLGTERDTVPTLLVGLGVVTTATALVGIAGVGLFGASAGAALGLCLGLATLGVVCSRLARSYRVTAAAAVVAALLGTVVGVGWAVLVQGVQPGSVSVPTTFAVLLSVFALVPAGQAFARRQRLLAVGTAAVGFLALALAAVPVTAPSVGLTGVFLWVLAVAFPLLGSPLLVAGMLLARDDASADESERADGTVAAN